MLRLLGCGDAGVIGKSLNECGLWSDAKQAERAIAAALRGDPQELDVRVARPAGAPRELHVHVYAVEEAGQRYLACEALDVTDQRATAHSLRLAGTAFAHMSEGVVIVDAQARYVSVNPAFTEMTGYTAEEAVGRTPRELLHEPSGRHDPAFFRAVAETVNGSGSWSGEMWSRKKSGEVFPQRVSIASVRDADGSVVNHVAVLNDITAVKAKQAQLEHIAQHDALTALPNRKLFTDRCNVALLRAARNKRSVAVLCVDLDLFKPVNDRHGHAIGDELLVSVAMRLTASVRASDTVARVGGDEFVLLLDDVTQRADAVGIASKVIAALSSTFHVRSLELVISASIGIALSPAHGTDTAMLLKHADDALYAAKNAGRNRYAVYAETRSEK